MSSSMIHITHFTDPGCPFAFSAEPRLRLLAWSYGDQITVEHRMIVLASSPEEYTAKGFTPELMAKSHARLQQLHGMPINAELRSRMSATRPACAAVVAARLHMPDRVDRLLRALRVSFFAGGFLDDPEMIAGAARVAGIDAEGLAELATSDEVASALEADMDAARHPSPSALAQNHKLAPWPGGRRYTAPSLLISAGGSHTVDVPGFQPTEAIDVAVAHVAPDVTRRGPAATVAEVLEWAPFSLATAEIAAIRGIDIDGARTELAELSAHRTDVGEESYWSLEPASVAH